MNESEISRAQRVAAPPPRTRLHAGLTLRRAGARGCSEGRGDAAGVADGGEKVLAANFHFREEAGGFAAAAAPGAAAAVVDAAQPRLFLSAILIVLFVDAALL